jgi:transcriptional regulator with XRE-family HTH domain
MDNASIKKNIRKVRESRKLTQEELAHKLGMSLSAYRELEKGGTSILNSNLLKMASYLDTPTEELVLGYQPAQADGIHIRKLQKEHSDKEDILTQRISDLENLVRAKNQTIADKDDIIASKNEIIGMLKKMLSEKDGDSITMTDSQ